MSHLEYQDVLVYVEQRDGLVQKVSLELISKGRAMPMNSALNLKVPCFAKALKHQ